MSEVKYQEIIERHVPYIVADEQGNIVTISKSAEKYLSEPKAEPSLSDYFPEVALSEGSSRSIAKNLQIIEMINFDVLKLQNGDWKIYFTPDLGSSKDASHKQLQLAELAVLGEITAGIAHEISNPLTIISGLAKHILTVMEREKIESQAIGNKARRIEDTVKRITEIVNAIRKLTRGLKEDEPKVDVPVQTLLKESLALTTFKLANNNVALDISEYDKSLSIECQPVQLVQVLMNLVNNAADALEGCDNPEIKIEVQTREENVVFIVKDSAASLKQDMYDKIFEQNVTTKQAGKGTGLGLYLSKKIVLSHDGNLKAFVKGGWTVFELEVPKVATQNGVRAA